MFSFHEAEGHRLVARLLQLPAHDRGSQFVIGVIYQKHTIYIMQPGNGPDIIMVTVGTRKDLHEGLHEIMKFPVAFFIIGELGIEAVFDNNAIEVIAFAGSIGYGM